MMDISNIFCFAFYLFFTVSVLKVYIVNMPVSDSINSRTVRIISLSMRMCVFSLCNNTRYHIIIFMSITIYSVLDMICLCFSKS